MLLSISSEELKHQLLLFTIVYNRLLFHFDVYYSTMGFCTATVRAMIAKMAPIQPSDWPT